jgi:hypothetical protein
LVNEYRYLLIIGYKVSITVTMFTYVDSGNNNNCSSSSKKRKEEQEKEEEEDEEEVGEVYLVNKERFYARASRSEELQLVQQQDPLGARLAEGDRHRVIQCRIR